MVHEPRRDDEIETWLKAKRDEWEYEARYYLSATEAHARAAWTVVNTLLDDYRLHADTGTPLSEEVHEHEEF